MGRAPRYLKQNTVYHTYSRCRQLGPLLKPEHIKQLLEEVIAECLERYEFQLIGHVIMDNHIHLIIKTLNNGAHTISEIMKWIKSTFSRRYNRQHNQIGPFWNERFGAKVVSLAMDAGDYLNTLLWYLAYNPVRSGAVNNPRDYKFGSINHYLEEKNGKELYKESPLANKITLTKHFLNLAPDVKRRLKKFLKFEELFKKRASDYQSSKSAEKVPLLQHLHRIFISREREKEMEKLYKREKRKTQDKNSSSQLNISLLANYSCRGRLLPTPLL